MLIDTSKRPVIYRTDNPNHYGRICIDFQPESVPTVASFGELAELSSISVGSRMV
jgi:hypothetical protein